MKKLFCLVMFALLLPACLPACPATDNTVTMVVQKAGYTEVRPEGWDMWQCSSHDTFGGKFSARNAQGQRVSGVVCCGWLKNCTVRF